MYRFLLSARWLGFLLFVVVLAGVCIRLGFWQWHRLEHKLVTNDVVREHFAADPVPIDDVLGPDDRVTPDTEWTRVTVKGVYDTSTQVTVKFMTRDGAPGVDVVTPLVTSSGKALIVDRGWMQTQNTVAKPTDVPAPPSGTVEVTGWLRPDNGAGDDAVKPSDGQVRAISSAALAGTVGAPVYGGYLNLREQSPGGTDALDLEPEPDLGQGPHLFYAIQWWFFAGLAIVGYVWFARVEAKERREGKRPARVGDEMVAITPDR